MSRPFHWTTSFARIPALVLPLFVCSAMHTSVALAADITTTFSQIKASIAVIGTDDKVGTGFCISSTGTASYYLTNAHVVGNSTTVTIYRHDPVREVLKGTVVATGGAQLDPDLAVVKVPIGNVPALHLRMSAPEEGSPAATAGYPSAQYALASFSGELVPSVHVGTISAVVNRGRVLEYDAQTLPGNSGGPLIDPATGDVVGVVVAKIRQSNEANIAIGIGPVVAPFLRQNDVAYTPALEAQSTGTPTLATSGSPSENDGPLTTLPGAGVVAIVYDTSRSTGNGAAQSLSAAAVDFAEKFGARFSVHTIAVDQPTSSAADLAEVAKTHNAIAAIPFGASFQTTSSYTNAYGTDLKMTLRLNSAIIDPYGYVWYGATKSKDIYSHKDPYSAVKSSLDDLSDQVVATIFESLQRSPSPESARVNLFRYGMPMADGDRRTFVGLSPDPNGARVVSIAPFSIASEAGLQLGDVVTAINGTSLAGKTQDEILRIQEGANSAGAVEFLVTGGDGKQQHIKFEAKDLRWYVLHRAATRN